MAVSASPRLPVCEIGLSSNCQSATERCARRRLDVSCVSRKPTEQWQNTSGVRCRTLLTNAEQAVFQNWKKVALSWRMRLPAITRTSTVTSTVASVTPIGGVENVRSAGESSAAALRSVLAAPGIHPGPACFDALSARLVEQAGFSYTFMSGFAVSAARLGAPDVGLLSYGEVLDQGRLITSAVSIPVIGDGDTGYGNALNVKRTVKGFIQAGFAGILIEDQVSPKSCGHLEGKRVVGREEALIRIKAAVDARAEVRGDIVIIARSDARQAESLEEALWRAEQFAQIGADVVFVDALASRDELVALCKVAPKTPKMANMLEGGGRTPILSPLELEELGFKLVAYPLSLLGVSIRAMQDALKGLKGGRLPPPGNLPSFDEINEVVGIKQYYEEHERYRRIQTPSPISEASGSSEVSIPAGNGQLLKGEAKDPKAEAPIPLLEGDVVSDIPDIQGIPGVPEDSVFVEPDVLEGKDASSTRGSLSAVWSRVLRVKITDINGSIKLDVRIPAGFLEGLSTTVPAVAGLDLRKLLDDAVFNLRGSLERGQQLLDFRDRRGERIQVFLE